MHFLNEQRKRVVWFGLAVIMLICSCGSDKKQISNQNMSGTPVRLSNPVKTDLTEYIDLNANTVFIRKEIVRATFPGFIEKKFANLGDEINTGDVLFQLKTKESAANENLHINLGDDIFRGAVEVRAKAHGVLTALNYNTGDFVNEGEEIAIISNPSSLRVTLNVPYQYVSKISGNEKYQIRLPDGKVMEAALQRVLPSVDPVAQTQTFLLQLDDRVRLPENLNVSARLPLRSAKDAVALPHSAVMSNETQDAFWVMQLLDDSTAIRVDIQKGIETDSLTQILAPILAPESRIISDGAYGLPDTAKVWITSDGDE